VSLGLDGATGLKLSELVAEGLVVPAPSLTNLTVGDDGTGVAAAPMSWIHINCGVSCHNENPNSTAYGSGMNLRLDPTLLDGRSSADFDTRTTTIGVTANNPMWSSEPRIVAGDPSHSLLVQLITSRGTANPAADQMPPIATSIVDGPDTQNVIGWIAKMPPEPGDGGEADAAEADASQGDASQGDASQGDASQADASQADASQGDGGEADAP
jgi:hypothetical protein